MDKTQSERAAEFFGDRAGDYENFIERLAPRYWDAMDVLMSMIPFERDRAISVLDIGAGTGLLTRAVLDGYENAHVFAIDASQDMLDQCAHNLARFGDRLTLRQGLFPDVDIGGGYDLVVSGLALHHLTDTDKASGFQIIFEALAPGGAFLAHDYVKAETAAVGAQYEALFWREAGESGDDLSWFREHRKADIPATVSDQLDWMRAAGFGDVDCHWRRLVYAVFGGRKPNT
jgi:tRNA (cmo5U34)-methyltransferase